MNLKKLDEEFTNFVYKTKINEPYLFLTPTNKNSEKNKFLFFFSKNKKYEPKFEYLKPNLNSVKNKLEYFNLNFLKIKNKNLKKIYLDKSEELKLFVSLIDNINLKDFKNTSSQIHGKTKVSLFFFAKFIGLFKPKKKEKILLKEEIKNYFLKYCKQNKLDKWDLKFKTITSQAIIINNKKKLILNKDINYDLKEIQRLLNHELGTHFKRYKNGRKISGLFSIGLKNYDELEEGLATFNEGNLFHFLEIAHFPALKYIAVHYSLKYSFYEAFKKIYKITLDKNLSFDLILRAKRGTFNNSGAYTKDKLYFSGYLKVILLYLFNRKKLKKSNIGKISFDDLNTNYKTFFKNFAV